MVAWDITKSNINENCTGDVWNFSTGQTIFGLTSTTGTSVISYIGFVSSLDEVTAINAVHAAPCSVSSAVYSLDGKFMGNSKRPSQHGVYVVNNKKVAM